MILHRPFGRVVHRTFSSQLKKSKIYLSRSEFSLEGKLLLMLLETFLQSLLKNINGYKHTQIHNNVSLRKKAKPEKRETFPSNFTTNPQFSSPHHFYFFYPFLSPLINVWYAFVFRGVLLKVLHLQNFTFLLHFYEKLYIQHSIADALHYIVYHWFVCCMRRKVYEWHN